MKIAHIADVHLDIAFALFSADVARARRQGIEAALRGALGVACESDADAVLIAGDLYEHDRVAPDTGEFLRALFADVAPVRIFIAPGNHDWYRPASLYARLEWPANVRIFREDRLEPVELEDGLMLWGAAHRAPANTDGFLDGFHVDRDGINIALFHGSELGSFGFQAEGKVPHAPFRAEQIVEAGLAHVFCGHYHTPVDGETYTYPGNPEPLTFGEEGNITRGVVLATIGSDGSVERERRSVAVTDVCDVTVDVSGAASGSEIRQRVAAELAGRSGCGRVTMVGELASDVDLSLGDVERAEPSLMAIVARTGALTTAYDLETIRQENSVRGEFVSDVLESDLSESLKQKVVVTGLRALEGRADLEVV